MSAEYERLKKILQEYEGVIMGPIERRAQSISWAYGQIALTSPYRDATPEQLATLRAQCGAAHDKIHPDWEIEYLFRD